jgi:Phosphoinositide phospholipase C, Ca2+-dependent
MYRASRAALILAAASCGTETAPVTTLADAAVQDDASLVRPDSASGEQDAGRDAKEAGVPAVPFNAVVSKSVHNAYEREEPLFDQLAFHRVRSIEVDIHNTKSGSAALPFDWYVYHIDLPLQRDTSCQRFSDCLDQLAAFHLAMPKHEVITLLVDLKDDLSGDHDAAALDAMLTARLGSMLYKPADVSARCGGKLDLRSSVGAACGWPSLDDLRGRVMVVLTGGNACAGTGKLAGYAGKTGLSRASFIAPSIDDSCAFSAYTGQNNTLFYNMDLAHAAAATQVRAAGFMTRVYAGGAVGGLDKQSEWTQAASYGTHLLATNKVNALQDPWATTISGKSFPFRCASCTLPAEEQGRALGFEVRSGDIEARADSFVFLHDEVRVASQWDAVIASPSSHVEPFAKACLMARVSLAPGSPYFAVCRPADANPLRIQYRTTVGGDTTSIAISPRPGWNDESQFFARLRVAGTTVIGEGSADGKSWATIGQAVLPQAPVLQGLAASGHDSASAVRFLFLEARRLEGASTLAFSKASAKALACIGICGTQKVTEGAAF